jgi:hypothetical protein
VPVDAGDGRSPHGRERGTRRPHRRTDRRHTAFSEADLDMAQTFAGQAAIALELADARAVGQHRVAALKTATGSPATCTITLSSDLFAVGLGLQGTAAKCKGTAIRRRLAQAVDEAGRRPSANPHHDLRPPSRDCDKGLRSRVKGGCRRARTGCRNPHPARMVWTDRHARGFRPRHRCGSCRSGSHDQRGSARPSINPVRNDQPPMRTG